MSHFTVLVLAKDENELAQKLQPFHEYECTGVRDEFVVWVDDIHDKYLKEYQSDTIEVVMHDGRIVDTKYSNKPLIEAMWNRAGIGISSRDKFVLAEGYELVDMPFCKYFDDFEAFMNEWVGYGTDSVNPASGRYERLTNPNAKWDWWQIGGRWTGKYLLKAPDFELEGTGEPGLMTEPNTDPYRADMAESGNIDWQQMREDSIKQRTDTYRTFHKAYDEFDSASVASDKAVEMAKRFSDWAKRYPPVLESIKTAVEFMRVDAAFEAINRPFWGLDFYKALQKPIEEYTKPEALTYAFIDSDGQWNQIGEMGWWGMDDKSKGTVDYDSLWWKFVMSLPDEQRVYAVDCHI